MYQSKLLAMMFEPERWEALLDKCVEKGINKGELRKLMQPEVRIQLYKDIRDERKTFSPGHQAEIPKDDGGVRVVYVGETPERVICSLINDCLFELCPQLVHPACKSYQHGLSCGKAVQEFARIWGKNYGRYSVVKTDYHHYFDDVSRICVFKLLDKIEDALDAPRGEEPVINLLRKMFNSDWLFDVDGNLIQKWSGIRQGNAVGSFFADAMLYDLDTVMSKKYPYYVRYSDDSITLAEDPGEAIDDISTMIQTYGVSLNPKKIEVVKDSYVKFLGFSVNGYNITLSKNRIKNLQHEIYMRTVAGTAYKWNATKCLNAVNKFLYKGDKEGHSWATGVLPYINVESDIHEIDEWILDCLKETTRTHRKKVGGLGYVPKSRAGVIVRGRGEHVGTNKQRIKWLDGYYTLYAMQKAMQTRKAAYETLVRTL